MSNHHKIPAMFHGQKIGRKGLRFFWAGQSCEPIGFPRCAFLVLLVICMTKKKSDLTRNNGGLTNWNGSFSNGNGGWTWFNQPNGSITGWWFGTCFIFYNIWDNPSHWLIFFKMVKTTNQIMMIFWDTMDIILDRVAVATACDVSGCEFTVGKLYCHICL